MPANRTTTERPGTNSQEEGKRADKIRKWLAGVVDRARDARRTFYAIVECEASPVDPLELLHQSDLYPQVYWAGRHGEREYAGIGSVATFKLSGADALRDATERAVGVLDRCDILPAMTEAVSPRFFAGFSFDPSAGKDTVWFGYDDAILILPQILYIRDRVQSRAFCTVEVCPQSDTDELIAALDIMRGVLAHRSPSAVSAPLPAIVTSGEGSDQAGWTGAVETALQQMKQQQLEKVVLSRRISLTATTSIPAWSVMHRLRNAAAGCFHFCFCMSADRSFVGASPERLFRITDRELETESMAGTTNRGRNAADDRVLAEALLASAKDRLEHFYVLEDSLRCLGELCTTMNADTTPRVVGLSTLQHLVTSVRGRLKDGVNVGEVLERLHPTPAVGGSPRRAALATIRDLEPHPRGWYCGPVGWIERDRAEFTVAIRSAMLSGADACVFAGAGIVPGSIPEQEWQETENKAMAFVKAVWE